MCRAFCAVGSVKTNVGHLESAAGIVGLFKAVLALKHKELPPTLNVTVPNKHIEFEASPFFINDRLRAWERMDSRGTARPRRAGVSAFGFGGTNVHVVLEEAPEGTKQIPSVEDRAYLLVLSARSRPTLRQLCRDYRNEVATRPDLRPGDVCLTASVGRKHFDSRVAMVLSSWSQLADKLDLIELSENWSALEKSCIFSSREDASREAIAKRLERLAKEVQDSDVPALAAALYDVLTGTAKALLRDRLALQHPGGGLGAINRCSSDWEHLLMLVAKWFAAGADIDWAALYEGKQSRRIALPLSRFERQRCWISTTFTAPSTLAAMPIQSFGSTTTVAPPTDSRSLTTRIDRWFFRAVWEPRREPPPPSATSAMGGILLLHDRSALADRLAELLESSGWSVCRILPGESFTTRTSRQIEIDPAKPKHYKKLWRELARQGFACRTIVHLWALDGASAELKDAEIHLAHGIGSLHLLCREMERGGFSRPREIRIITRGAQRVGVEDRVLNVAAAAITPLLKTIAQEMPGIFVQALDLDDTPTVEETVHLLRHEVARPIAQSELALRGGRWWSRVILPLDFASLKRRPLPLRRGGVYLITGGLGGIGLALAEHLATQWNARLALVGRTELPPEDRWTEWMSRHANQHRTRRKMQTVQRLRAAGVDVLLAAADVADAQSMKDVIERVIARYGELHGVFHAAGTSMPGPLARKKRKDFQAALRPKVAGSLALHEALSDVPLDFVVLFSSVASVLGSAEQGDYAAANGYLDAFAAWRNDQGLATTSIQWGVWGEVGMGVAAAEKARQMKLLEPMKTSEALAALERTLGFDLADVIVANTGPAFVELAGSIAATERNPVDHDPIVPAFNDPNFVEELLVERLAKVLEVAPESIDRHRGFAELGLDSILVVQLTRDLESQLGQSLSYTVIHDYPNIVALAKHLAAIKQTHS
jgi:acyl transferase domain-containing protein/acyl carrier protein